MPRPAPPDPERIAEIVEDLRRHREARFTIPELVREAEARGLQRVARSYVYDVEAGRKVPSTKLIETYGALLEIPPERVDSLILALGRSRPRYPGVESLLAQAERLSILRGRPPAHNDQPPSSRTLPSHQTTIADPSDYRAYLATLLHETPHDDSFQKIYLVLPPSSPSLGPPGPEQRALARSIAEPILAALDNGWDVYHVVVMGDKDDKLSVLHDVLPFAAGRGKYEMLFSKADGPSRVGAGQAVVVPGGGSLISVGFGRADITMFHPAAADPQVVDATYDQLASALPSEPSLGFYDNESTADNVVLANELAKAAEPQGDCRMVVNGPERLFLESVGVAATKSTDQWQQLIGSYHRKRILNTEALLRHGGGRASLRVMHSEEMFLRSARVARSSGDHEVVDRTETALRLMERELQNTAVERDRGFPRGHYEVAVARDPYLKGISWEYRSTPPGDVTFMSLSGPNGHGIPKTAHIRDSDVAVGLRNWFDDTWQNLDPEERDPHEVLEMVREQLDSLHRGETKSELAPATGARGAVGRELN